MNANASTHFFICLSAVASLLLSASASGQLAQNMTLGNAKALALANAVTADPPGIDAIHFNPAGLTLLDNRQYQVKVFTGYYVIRDEVIRTPLLEDILESTDFEETLDPGSTQTSDGSAMLPFMGLTELSGALAIAGGISVSSPDNKYTFATAVYTPMITGFKRKENSVARYQGNQVGITHLTYFSPSIAMQFDEYWSIGASLVFSYAGIGIDLDMRATNEFLGQVETFSQASCGEDGEQPIWNGVINLCDGQIGPFAPIGNLFLETDNYLVPSINVGVLWQPTDWFSLGAVYQSQASATLKGDYKLEYDEGWSSFFQGLNRSLVGVITGGILPQGVAQDQGDVQLNYVLAAHFSAGFSIKVFPDWKLNLDLKWTDTDAWNELEIEFEEPLDISRALALLSEKIGSNSVAIPLNYQSTWNWALGIEFQYNDQIALRAGYEDRPTALPDDGLALIAPLGDATLIGFGVSYVDTDWGEFDFGFGWLSSDSESKANREQLTPENAFYTPYAGYDLKNEINAYLLEFSYRTAF